MILHDLTGSEEHAAYQALEIENGARHYSFLESIVAASLAVERPFLSQSIIKALNYHAIACLHSSPGEYRPCLVAVGDYIPPPDYKVQSLMDDFVNIVNRQWDKADPVVLCVFVLWRLNHIHPFINGNGRTARAASYYVLCIKLGGWLRGDVILPELLRGERPKYIEALKAADESLKSGSLNLSELHALVVSLLDRQLYQSTPPDAANNPSKPG
ncbi:MAG: Fic family protein [Paracoccaceae bacterium]